MSALRRHRRPTWPVWGGLLLTGLLAVRIWMGSDGGFERLPQAASPVQVVRAVDGDTLLLATGHRVRLIGVDTPETKHPERPPEPFGEEAAAFTRARVDGREVRLEYDRERVDPYRRVLAYVTVDGELLNEAILRAGYSRAVTSFAYRGDMQRRFRQAAEAARDSGRGIWSVPSANDPSAVRPH